MRTWIVTGASRGIGNKLVAEILSRYSQDEVIATSTKAGTVKFDDPRVSPYVLDTGVPKSIEAFAEAVKGKYKKIDILVNNAAINYGDDVNPTHFKPEEFSHTLNVNVVGPAYIAELLVEPLDVDIIVNYSSGCGCMSGDLIDLIKDRVFTYSVSKTALNMVTTKQAQHWPKRISIAVDPGSVLTDMNPKGRLTTFQSVDGVLAIISKLTQADSGKFYNYDGVVYPLA